jgi:predicted lipid-binding transport protein (Tim44 family)
MVRSTKPTTSTPVSEVKPAVVASVDAPAKEVKKASKKASAPKAEASAPVTPAPVSAPAIVSAPAVDAAPAAAASAVALEPEVISSEAKLNEVDAKIQQIGSILATLKTDFKALRKSVAREKKLAEKSKGKASKRSSGNRKPSGFIKPTLISDELATFLGKTSGTEMARTDVSKEINAYICAHNLKDKANGRIIHPDAKLSALLKITSGNELTFFNLQSYMKHHFIKTEPVAVVA